MFPVELAEEDLYMTNGEQFLPCFSSTSFVLEHGVEFANHLGITHEDFCFLANSSAVRPQSHFVSSQSHSLPDTGRHDRRHEGRDEENDERSHDRTDSRDGKVFGGDCDRECEEGKIKGQGVQDGVRSYPSDGTRCPRPPSSQDNLAVFQPACSREGLKSLGPVGTVRKVRIEDGVHPGCRGTGAINQDRVDPERARTVAQVEDRWPRGTRHDKPHGQVDDHHCGQGEGIVEPQAESKGQSSCQESTSNFHAGGRQQRRGCEECGNFQRGDGEEGEEEGPLGGRGVKEVTGAQQGRQRNVHHDVSHNDDLLAEEVHERCMSTEELKLLRECADDFNHDAILAKLQDATSSTMWEVCCRVNSGLANECMKSGMTALRKTLETGYDLEKESTVDRLKKDRKNENPSRAWFSLKCTEWTNIQNINQRTSAQIELLRKKEAEVKKDGSKWASCD